MKNDTRRGGKEYLISLLIIFLILVCFRGCTTSVAQTNTHTEVVTVCDKGSVQRGRYGHEYRIYTSAATYVVKDYYGLGDSRFDSADLYGRIKVGETYIVDSYGYRIPLISAFWNITEATSTQQEPTGTCG